MQPDHRGSPSPSAAADASGSKNKSETARWTEEEEVRLLRTALEIAREPVESFDATVSPVERVRRAVGGDFTAKEIVQKTKQLRKRYEDMCCRRLRNSSGEADADVFGTSFELSDQIWGSHGGDKENEKGNGKEGDRNAA
ncbi:hypothetical protein IEQ34_002496 [Dendrobium chrysotoxum]|uniref:Glabrous enhancer-binding protein-like DBD domain-containing protein n=1 Tax=Dendrobium chrysotoxum TaxID=161865 RepID=A0AAV7HNA0_DENCH|nr:hypothetical protein IEQ34_002496 [Dendrobium chrysotoxum]